MTDQATKPKSVKLSREDRDTLYNPGTYEVKRVNKLTYSVRSVCTGLMFYASQTSNGFRVWNDGRIWNVDMVGVCNCPDYYRATKMGRFCKHQSIVVAVEEFMNREKRRLLNALGSGVRSREEIRAEIKEMFR